ncbi:hypothetical protein L484_009569 [Morus notabilis]|uniref:Exportin-T n=1 Tax=Morus notabilis TaxID=981085 RepID=W9QBR4_9ROSA|nr:hypothetical protein L484_009569 [Morus notabilis]
MADLEKAILILFDESGAVDSELKLKAKEYCEKFKEEPAICRICIERLCFSNLIQVQFWCLQTLHDVIRVGYSSMSQDERYLIKKSVFLIACFEGLDDHHNAVRVLQGPAFIKNKLAQVLVTLIYSEYPLIWSSMFVDFLPHLSKGAAVIDMFCRVLNALDVELISLDYPRTPEELAVGGLVKDEMRQHCVPQIVRAWFDVISMYRNSDQEVCTSVLESMRRYVSWIDIGLIVNDAFIPLLFELVLVDGLSEQLRGAAAGCLLAVVSKRMDHQTKLSLLQSLRIRRVFGLVNKDSDSELISSIAALLTGYAVEVLECFKRLNSEDAKAVSVELLDDVLPSVFYVMQHCELDSTFNIVQFLSSYVGTMKSLSPLREKQLLHVGQILEVIRSQIRYDPMYRGNLDTVDKIGREEEDRMVEFRKDMFVLLRCVGRVAPDVTHVFIQNSLVSAVASPSDRNVEEVEAALSLLYALGESMNDEAIRTGSGLLSELVPMLLSTRFPCHSSRLVALVYLETIIRYLKFVQENTQHIPMVLSAFLDERGIHHPSINVSRRASYLFTRVVKLLKVKLVPFIETILQSLQDTVARFTSMNHTSKELSGSEDGSHIFEAIGLLIGMEDVPPAKQSDYLSSLLTPLCQQVMVRFSVWKFIISCGSSSLPPNFCFALIQCHQRDTSFLTLTVFIQVEALLMNVQALTPEETPVKLTHIQQIIIAINSLSKDVLTLCAIQGFSERLVTASRPAIGLMFKQTLDVLLQVLIVFPKIEPLRIKPKEMVGLLVLLNQLICKFNTSVHDILDEVFPAIAGRILSVIPRDVFPSGPGTNTEACVQIFIRLIKDWCAKPLSEEKVPGFQNFIIENFSTNCCLYSLLERSFEFRDANTFVLFGEIVSAQKVMHEKFGDDFLVHFVSKGLSAAHCPQDLAEQYCRKLQVA